MLKEFCKNIVITAIVQSVVYITCFSADAAEADRYSQACNRVSRTVDADADVDETVPSINRNSSTLSLVSCVACFDLCISALT